MDLSAILSSQGLAVAIVVAGGFGIYLACRWIAPRLGKLFDTVAEKGTEFVDHHNTMVTTLTENNTTLTENTTKLTENTTATKDLLQGISVTLDGHGSMLKEHRDRLEEHRQWLEKIHHRVHEGPKP